jgi:hypothetical protein
LEVRINTVRKENRKVYIEDVRKVSWDTGEMCEFASSLVSAMNSLGENILYYYVMGTSGVAFRFTLNPGEWDFSNYGIRNITPDTYAPIRRAFAAAGYAYSLNEPGSFQDDAAKIMDSIDQGIPVLAFRVVGPSDCCILTGYDEGGEVLLGWSTYQNIPDDHNLPHDVTGYFRKPGWHENIAGYILIGAKVSRPPLRAIYLDALAWAVHLMRMPEMDRKVTGLRALQTWAEEMTQAKYFPAGDDAVIGQRYVSAAINMTMLRDHCLAEPFLHQAAEDVPDFQPELFRATDCYGEVRRLRDSMDDLIADNFSEQAMKAITDPEIRRAYADAILRIHDAEVEAINQIEYLLKRCG